jgi:hypothetical protein
MILDLSDLQKLSGYQRPHDVKKWLRNNGVAFMVQASGNPVTTLDAVNRTLLGSIKRSEPDFSAPPAKSRRAKNRNYREPS